MTSTLTTNPNDGLAALEIVANIGGQNYDIFLDDIQDISAPGNNALSLTGYITTADVPEPGSMALLLGIAVTGTALLRRRRRK